MERFREYDDIYGKVNISYLTSITREIFELAADIRNQLGKQGYLLEKYLSCFMEGVVSVYTHEIAEEGFYLCSELHGIIMSVITNKSNEHPFYETVKEYIDAHPLEYQEKDTLHSIYTIALMDSFLEFKADEYRHKLKESLRAVFDIVELSALPNDIESIIGEGPMEKLHLLLCQRFLFVTHMKAFVQGVTNDLLQALTHRDDETSKLAVSLWLDMVECHG